MFAKRKSFWRDECGAAMVEFTAAALTFFLLVFGSVEFANAYYQWNAATKAVQWGARLAAVSNPVATDLITLTDSVTGLNPGDLLGTNTYDFVCDGHAASCTCTGTAALCPGTPAYNLPNMQTIVFGRDATGTAYSSCQTSPVNMGMCNIFTRISSVGNVTVRYQYTGLGYVGRPGAIPQVNGVSQSAGAVPTITVSLHQRVNAADTDALKFEFILIGGLMNAAGAAIPGGAIDMPSFATTVTGEDLTAKGS